MFSSLSLIQTILSAGAATSGLLFNLSILSVLIWQRRVSTDRTQNASNTLLLLNLAIVDILFCLTILFASTPISLIFESSFKSSEEISSFIFLGNYDSSSVSSVSEEDISNQITTTGLSTINFTLSPSPTINPNQHSLLYLVSQIQGFLWTSLPIIFVWTVTGITMDKYIAISHPFHYSRFITTRRATIFIFVSWLTGLSLSLPPLFGVCMYTYSPYRSANSIHCDINGPVHPNQPNHRHSIGRFNHEWTSLVFVVIYLLFSIIIPLLAITICNFHILMIAENHRHRIITAIYEITLQGGGTSDVSGCGLTLSSSSSPVSTPRAATPVTAVLGRSKSAESLNKRCSRDAFLPVSQLIGSLLLFTTPSYIIFCLESLDGIAIHPAVISLVTFCLTLMPSINAYIYGVKSKLLRQTFKRLLHRYLYKQDVSQEIERRLSSRSQGSQNSLHRYDRRNSCPVLAGTSYSTSRARTDFWLSNGSSLLKTPPRRQSMCIVGDNCRKLASSKGLSLALNRALNPIRTDYFPQFKLFQTDSIVKLSPIEEQTTSSESV